jgi:hypothetical protein
MGWNRCYDVNSYSGSQNTSSTSCGPMILYHVHKSAPLLPVCISPHPVPLIREGSKGRVLVPVGSRILSYPRSQVQIYGLPSLLSCGYRALSPRVMRLGGEADQSPPASAEVKTTWIYTPTSPYAFMALCLVKHRDNFTCSLTRLVQLILRNWSS